MLFRSAQMERVWGGRNRALPPGKSVKVAPHTPNPRLVRIFTSIINKIPTEGLSNNI